MWIYFWLSVEVLDQTAPLTVRLDPGRIIADFMDYFLTLFKTNQVQKVTVVTETGFLDGTLVLKYKSFFFLSNLMEEN